MTIQSPMLDVAQQVAKGPPPDPPKTKELVWDFIHTHPWCEQKAVVEALGMKPHTVYQQLKTLVSRGMLKMEKREKRLNKDDKYSHMVCHYHTATVEEMEALTGLKHAFKVVHLPKETRGRPKGSTNNKPALLPGPATEALMATVGPDASRVAAELRRLIDAEPDTLVAEPNLGFEALLQANLMSGHESLSRVSIMDALHIYRFLRPILG